MNTNETAAQLATALAALGQPMAMTVAPDGSIDVRPILENNTPAFAKTSPTFGRLAAALAAAQGAIKNPTKGKEVAQERKGQYGNTTVRYAYTPLDEIIDAAKAALAANGVAYLQPVTGTVEGITVSTILVHSSGEWVQSDPLTATPDEKNKTAQGMGSIMTYLRRYQLAAMLGIQPADEDDDGNAGTGNDAQITDKRKGGQQPAPAGDKGQPSSGSSAQAQQRPDLPTDMMKPPSREQYDNASGLVLSFGKHKGTALGAVPEDYLDWLQANATTQSFKVAAGTILKFRALEHAQRDSAADMGDGKRPGHREPEDISQDAGYPDDMPDTGYPEEPPANPDDDLPWRH